VTSHLCSLPGFQTSSCMAAAATAKAVVPPPSTFAELLRRSRFSSYDLAIAQTYSAPPASARRGNYGLKRAIPMPYKDSYISVPTFEHHAHFTDWNNAEQQVKFVRRMEELNVVANPFPRSPWHEALGDATHQWLIDSEFAELDYPRRASGKVPVPAPPSPVSKGQTDDLRSFGKQGPHQYGARRPLPTFSAVQPNYESLSPKQFQRYLSQLRKLRPEFRAYLNRQYKARRAGLLNAATIGEGPARLSEELAASDLDNPDDFLLLVAAQNPVHTLHRRFLAKQFSKNYAKDTSSPTASSKIEARPHRNGGLSYCHPSDLQSLLTSPPLPGIAFQDNAKTPSQFARERSDFRKKRDNADCLILLGDLLVKLPNQQSKVLQPVYYPDTPAGVATVGPLERATAGNTDSTTTNNTGSTRPHHNFSNSTGQFRIVRCFFKQLPQVVSYKNQHRRPSELLNETSIIADAVSDLPWTQRNQSNPHKPGSPQYITHISTNPNRLYSPNTYNPSTMTHAKTFAYGSQFEAASRLDQERKNKANLQRLVDAEANQRSRKKEIDEMGMGVGVGVRNNGYSPEARASMVSTLSSIVSRGNAMNKGNEGQDGNKDDEDL
jgi:hypothetical protein